jgi:hypothetical protein
MRLAKYWWGLLLVLALSIGFAGSGCGPQEEEFEAPVIPESEVEEPEEPAVPIMPME